MHRAQRTAAAEQDLENIGYQIAVVDGRYEVAVQVLRELVAECDKLAELANTSRLGTEASEIGEGVRLFPCKRWVILFRYVDNGILVLRIVDGGQDYLAWKI